MANHHFGKLADVWKHLVLNEVLDGVRPARYLETHAGSDAYPLVDDPERRYGAVAFATARDEVLDRTPYARVLTGFMEADAPSYPGSALQAMTLLGDHSAYVLCDLDPASAADLREWADRLSLHSCEVVEDDGMAVVQRRLDARGPVVR